MVGLMFTFWSNLKKVNRLRPLLKATSFKTGIILAFAQMHLKFRMYSMYVLLDICMLIHTKYSALCLVLFCSSGSRTKSGREVDGEQSNN